MATSEGSPLPERPYADWAVVELVYESPRSLPELTAELRNQIQQSIELASAFGDELDNFFFLTLNEIMRDDQPEEIFRFARELLDQLDAKEVNPVLPDSLFGGAALGGPEALSGLCETPRIEEQPLGWPHDIIGIARAWSENKGGGGKAAVIDTGYTDHEELDGVICQEGHLNLVEGGTDARDPLNTGFLASPGHGTTVSSVIASRGGLSQDYETLSPGVITGTAPEAEVLPIRAIKSVVNASQKTIPAAISHAISQSVDVMVMAMGGPIRICSTESALRSASEEGVLSICAAGNCWPFVVFPAAYARYGLSTSVAAITRDLDPWRVTGRGRSNVVSAPGENVWGASRRSQNVPKDYVRPSQGTTLSTSLTAGAALIWSIFVGGRLGVKELAGSQGTTGQKMFNSIVKQTAYRPPSWGNINDMGAGVLQADKLLTTTLATPVEDKPHPVENWGTIPTLTIAQDILDEFEPGLGQELDSSNSAFASEVIWRAYRSGARAWAIKTNPEVAAELPPERPFAADIARMLESKPRLRRALTAS